MHISSQSVHKQRQQTIWKWDFFLFIYTFNKYLYKVWPQKFSGAYSPHSQTHTLTYTIIHIHIHTNLWLRWDFRWFFFFIHSHIYLPFHLTGSLKNENIRPTKKKISRKRIGYPYIYNMGCFSFSCVFVYLFVLPHVVPPCDMI